MTSRVMQDFNLLLPVTTSEALGLLATYNENFAVMAGGTDLLVALKFDYTIDNVISLALVPGLDDLSYDADAGLTIGAKVTIAQVLKSDDVRENYPALWQAAKVFATPQLRNTATILGNILRASPAGDCSLALYAYGGTLTLQNTSGQREVDLDDFWISYGVTERQNDELAISLNVPAPKKGQKSAFQRMTRTTEDLSKLNAAVCMQMEGDKCIGARVAMGCVGPTLVRLAKIENFLEAGQITDDLLQELSKIVASEINPIDDIRSSAEYRLKVAGVLVKRVIKLALDGGNDQ